MGTEKRGSRTRARDRASARRLTATQRVDLLVKQRRTIEAKLIASFQAVGGDGPVVGMAGQLQHEGPVQVRVHKSGLIYGLFLDGVALLYREDGAYTLSLDAQNPNVLRWLIRKTRPVWAYQIDLVVEGESTMVDRGQGASLEPKWIRKEVDL